MTYKGWGAIKPNQFQTMQSLHQWKKFLKKEKKNDFAFLKNRLIFWKTHVDR